MALTTDQVAKLGKDIEEVEQYLDMVKTAMQTPDEVGEQGYLALDILVNSLAYGAMRLREEFAEAGKHTTPICYYTKLGEIDQE